MEEFLPCANVDIVLKIQNIIEELLDDLQRDIILSNGVMIIILEFIILNVYYAEIL